MRKYYGEDYSDSYLMHYGRKGQRRGQHLPDIQALKIKALTTNSTAAYNAAKDKLAEFMAEAEEFEDEERPELDKEEYLKGKHGKRRINAANSYAYQQRKSDEAYYAKKNKYARPGLSNKR